MSRQRAARWFGCAWALLLTSVLPASVAVAQESARLNEDLGVDAHLFRPAVDSKGAKLGMTVQVHTPGSGGDLFTTAPSQVTLNTGAVVTYNINAGYPPYSGNSGNTNVARAKVDGSTLSLTAVGAGSKADSGTGRRCLPSDAPPSLLAPLRMRSTPR